MAPHPEIARTLARFRAHRAHRAHQLTKLALSALAAIIASTPDLIEQRRAATTILRTVTGPTTPRPRTRPSDPSPFDDDNDEHLDNPDDPDENEPESDDLDDTDELHDTDADLNQADDRESHRAEFKIKIEHKSVAAPVPPLGTQHSALSTRHSALPKTTTATPTTTYPPAPVPRYKQLVAAWSGHGVASLRSQLS